MSFQAVGGLSRVRSRIDQLETMINGTTSSPSPTSATSAAGMLGGTENPAFASALLQALSGTQATAGTAGTGTRSAKTPVSADVGKRAVDLAKTYTGVPYLWGGTNPKKGLDCSGLVQLVYRKLGIDLPRVSQQQEHSGEAVASLSQAQPGDLVFFGSPATHVGIYVGDGKMIDAPRSGQTVGVHKLWRTPSAIRRVVPETSPAAAQTSPALAAADLVQGTALLAAFQAGAASAASSASASMLPALLSAGLTSAGLTSSGLSSAGISSSAGLLSSGLLSTGSPALSQSAAASLWAAVAASSANVAQARAASGPTGSVTGPTATAGSSSVSAPSGSAGSTVSGPYSELFTAAGRKYGVDPALLSAVAKAESGYRPDARSPAGALGLMQIMPGTARSLKVDPLSPTQAVDGAARLLSGYLKDNSGRVDLALASYNAGPGAVKRYGGVPPYSETRTYIQRVTHNWEALR
jgi:cell wall-associated NlpC family hydrolase/soluble lytic murein transglycosylase-like protein